MTDKDRWLDADSEALGEALLAAGRAEHPEEAALGRTLTALSVTAATLTAGSELGAATGTASGVTKVAASAGAAGSGAAGGAAMSAGGLSGAASLPGGPLASVATKSGATVLVAKWLSGGVVVGAAAFGAVELADAPAPPVTQSVEVDALGDDSSEAPPKERASGPEAVSPSEEAVEEEPPAELSEESPERDDGLGQRAAEFVQSPKRVRGHTAVPQQPSLEISALHETTDDSAASPSPVVGADVAEAELPSRLREELALVDEARALLDLGNPGAALQKLASYRRRFGGGGLAPEALFLEMQAHHQAGHRERADAVARTIIERFPSGPHAGRAREILKQQNARRR